MVFELSFKQKTVSTGRCYKTSSLDIICGVPQGSILELLLFIIYVNDLCNASKIFELIMFADDTNLIFSHKNIKELFHTANLDPNKVFKWINANQLSVNKDKTKYTLFYKSYGKYNIPLKLSTFFISEIIRNKTNYLNQIFGSIN